MTAPPSSPSSDPAAWADAPIFLLLLPPPLLAAYGVARSCHGGPALSRSVHGGHVTLSSPPPVLDPATSPSPGLDLAASGAASTCHPSHRRLLCPRPSSPPPPAVDPAVDASLCCPSSDRLRFLLPWIYHRSLLPGAASPIVPSSRPWKGQLLFQ